MKTGKIGVKTGVNEIGVKTGVNWCENWCDWCELSMNTGVKTGDLPLGGIRLV